MNYALINAMNDRVLSKHRTLTGMLRAARSIQPKEANVYLPVEPRLADGSRLTDEDLEEWIRLRDNA